MWATSVKIHPQNKLCPCNVIWCVHWTDVEFDHFLVSESWDFSLPREVQKHLRDESSSRCLNSEIYRTLSITSDSCILRCDLMLPLFYYVLWKAVDQGWHRRCCELGSPEMNGTSCTSVQVICCFCTLFAKLSMKPWPPFALTEVMLPAEQNAFQCQPYLCRDCTGHERSAIDRGRSCDLLVSAALGVSEQLIEMVLIKENRLAVLREVPV